MKIIDQSARQGSTSPPNMVGRLMGRLSEAFSTQDARAQETFVKTTSRIFDDRFILLRNSILADLETPIPLILIGPPGMWVIYPSGAKGVFRAEETGWEELDSLSRRMKPSHPNLITRTALLAGAVEKFLIEKGVSLPSIEPILYFSDPGLHLEAVRPAARVIPSDALGRAAVGQLKLEPALDARAVERLTNLLIGKDPEALVGAAVEVRDIFTIADPSDRKPIKIPELPDLPSEEPGFASRLPWKFTSRQWRLLGVMLVLNILLLIALVLVVYFVAR